jgi:hypothetical protein
VCARRAGRGQHEDDRGDEQSCGPAKHDELLPSDTTCSPRARDRFGGRDRAGRSRPPGHGR